MHVSFSLFLNILYKCLVISNHFLKLPVFETSGFVSHSSEAKRLTVGP